MDFSLSPRAKELRDQTKKFIAEQVIPLENDPRQDSHGPHPELRAELFLVRVQRVCLRRMRRANWAD
jgi:hypothetical protein